MSVTIEAHPSRAVYISDDYVGSIVYHTNHGFMFQPSNSGTLLMTRDDLQDIIDFLNVENSKL